MLDTPFDRSDDVSAAYRGDDVDSAGEHLSAAPPAAAAGSPRPGGRRLWFGAALVVVVAAAWWLLRGAMPAPVDAPIPVVSAAMPLQKQVTEWNEYIGRFEASKSVEVRPQVSGQITSVHFTDGQLVRAGEPLFTIDSRALRAGLAQANAEVARASSTLALSQGNLARARRLVAEDAVAATEVDRLEAEVRNNGAVLAAARALANARSIDVGFTTVRAPISGRISDRRIDAGNLVAAGGGTAATLLTTINAVDPVYFVFTGSEALYLKARRAKLDNGTPVEIRLQDEADYHWHGQLDFTDNGLDPASGTIRARAVVRNGGAFLTPGLFGRMRLASGSARSALLVPDTAVTTDQTRKQLMVVGPDGTVAARTVELGPLIGGLRVIEKGLAPADRVIIKGVQMAIPGKKVRAEQAQIAPDGPGTAPAADSPASPVSRAASATLAN